MNENRPVVNYQLELDKVISDLTGRGEIPDLLLHSCCGPCSSYVVTYLKDFFDITVLYYNPNIYPQDEYELRLSEQKRLLCELNVPLMEIGYDHGEFLDHIKGYEKEPEGGLRCSKCFELRLKKTYEIALNEGFDYFCTTLTVSPHKNAMIINSIGKEIEEGKVLFLPSDFKKKDGYKRSIEISKQYDLYRQNYCGCEFANEQFGKNN